MSVEECGRECVHVTPTEWAALSTEPNQGKDLEAASIAAHHQGVFGLHGPAAFGWSASSCSESAPAGGARVLSEAASPAPRDQGVRSREQGSAGVEGGEASRVRAGNREAGRKARSRVGREQEQDPEPPPDLRYPDLESLAHGAASPRVPASTRPGHTGGLGSSDGQAGSELGGGAWEEWWEGGEEEGMDGDDGDLWRGSLTSASGAVTASADGAVRLQLLRPLQGEHVACGGPGCSVPLVFAVEGKALDAGRASASATVSINQRQAATFDDARSVTTGMVDLAPSWHILELHVSVQEEGRRGSQTALADARSFRVVHLLSSPQRGAVSFGTRGGCRLAESVPGLMAALCAVRPLGWSPEDSYDSEQLVSFPLDQTLPGGIHDVAVLVAEAFELGRIEALQIWQCFDRHMTLLAVRRGLTASLLPPPPPSRWAVMAADGTADYSFYLPIVAYIWQKVVGYNPLVMLVGQVWQHPPEGSPHAVVKRHLEQLAPGIKVQVIASDDSFNSAALAQVGRLYACIVDGIRDDDYLLTTDADLIPLSSSHFNEQRNWRRRMHLYNSFCCAPLQLPEGGVESAKEQCSLVELGASDLVRGGGVDSDHRLLHLPISYAGASAGVWREIMGLSHEDERGLRAAGVHDLLRLAVEARLVNDLGEERAHTNLGDNHRHADMDMWHLDQRVLSSKVAAWGGFPHDTEMTVRYGHRDRVDRMRWQLPPSLEGYVDAHLPQPGFTPANWEQTRLLLEMVLRPRDPAGEMLAWVDAYHSAFVQANR